MASWFGAACRPCSGANPEVDTVKVQMASSANAEGNPFGMDANQEALAAQVEADRVAREEAERERRKAEEALRRQEEEEAAAAAAVAAAAEAEEQQLRQQQEERMAAEEERRRLEAVTAQKEEENRRQRQAEEAKQRAQREAELKKVNEFLGSKGFAGINSKRKSFRKAKYPIHSVVKLNDTELAGLLVKHKADLSMKDSNNQTALSLAQKANKGGSHAAMINLLQAA